MSIPSASPPPGGYYAAPPSPPAKSGTGGCWKVAGIGCAAVFLLALIGGVMMVRNVKNQLAHPDRGSVIGMGVIARQAGANGVQIQQAIARYHTEHGKYPNSLLDLVQDGSLDGKTLHNNLDDNSDPGHLSWQYHKPQEGASGTTPLLEEPYHLTVGGTTQSGRLVIMLNGRSAGNTLSGRQEVNP